MVISYKLLSRDRRHPFTSITRASASSPSAKHFSEHDRLIWDKGRKMMKMTLILQDNRYLLRLVR